MQLCFTASPSLRQADVEIAKEGMMRLKLKAMGEEKWYRTSQSSPGVTSEHHTLGLLRNGTTRYLAGQTHPPFKRSRIRSRNYSHVTQREEHFLGHFYSAWKINGCYVLASLSPNFKTRWKKKSNLLSPKKHQNLTELNSSL